ncbi:hypothetical protein BU14_0517s0003 [Porphyra umbilicalis]|uniref:t-SNARE coiled-coil homology domain-containing protein n=1 Tax=Porphyra umbilicalis TaxID=2786 RepID=A0A1X6NSQ4_PORUM|nr:hypothetical protein BU14_0517s0003 [Porphyra umbilicalis]|eukprot:OSX71632.1 hypothetical protein BU14_0517s0003 [Porphyra umbilicalis]
MPPPMDRTAIFHRLLADTHGHAPTSSPGVSPPPSAGGSGGLPPHLVAPLSPPSRWMRDANALAVALRAASRMAAASRPAYADFSAAGMDDAGRDEVDAHLASVVADGMKEVARLSEVALAADGAGSGSVGGGGGGARGGGSLGGWLRSTLGVSGGGGGDGSDDDGAVGEVAYRLGITALLSDSLVAVEAETAALRGLRVAAAAAKARGVSVAGAGGGGEEAIRRRRAAAVAARVQASAAAERDRVRAAEAAARRRGGGSGGGSGGGGGGGSGGGAAAAGNGGSGGDFERDDGEDGTDEDEDDDAYGASDWGDLGGGGLGAPPELASAVNAAMEEAAAAEEAAWSAAHEQVLVSEHASLRSELLGTREAVRATEAAVAEVAELNALLGARVADQAAVIEDVYARTVEASSALRRGARELRRLESGEAGWDVTLLFAVAFFVLALCLLWLHWLNR